MAQQGAALDVCEDVVRDAVFFPGDCIELGRCRYFKQFKGSMVVRSCVREGLRGYATSRIRGSVQRNWWLVDLGRTEVQWIEDPSLLEVSGRHRSVVRLLDERDCAGRASALVHHP